MMNNCVVLKYKGYIAKVEYSVEDKCLHGTVQGIRDLITFETTDALAVEDEFHAAVDEYLEFCEEVGKEPSKMYSGSFNVRITPEIHKALDYYAITHDISLNSVVYAACEAFLNDMSAYDSEWNPIRESVTHINCEGDNVYQPFKASILAA